MTVFGIECQLLEVFNSVIINEFIKVLPYPFV